MLLHVLLSFYRAQLLILIIPQDGSMNGSMSNYMVPKPIAHLTSAPHSPLSPVSPQIPGVKHINYPATPLATVAQVPSFLLLL